MDACTEGQGEEKQNFHIAMLQRYCCAPLSDPLREAFPFAVVAGVGGVAWPA